MRKSRVAHLVACALGAALVVSTTSALAVPMAWTYWAGIFYPMPGNPVFSEGQPVCDHDAAMMTAQSNYYTYVNPRFAFNARGQQGCYFDLFANGQLAQKDFWGGGSGYVGAAYSCPNRSTWNASTSDCVCNSGFDPATNCQECLPDYVWADTGASSCISALSCTAGGSTIYLGRCTSDPLPGKNTCDPCDPAKGQVVVGDPINPGSGVATQAEPIFHSASLDLVLVYNSKPSVYYLPARPYPFGTGWSTRFDARVLPKAGLRSVGVVRPGGQIYSFANPKTGTVYTSDPDVPDTLTKLVDAGGTIVGFRYAIASNQTIEEFDAAGSLQTVTDVNGLVTSFDYSTAATPAAIAPKPGLLIRVTDPFGRTMSLTYDASSRVRGVVDPSGGSYTFNYDEATSRVAANNLTSIVFPDGTKRLFYYGELANTQDSQQPSVLTGITDEAGNRYVTFKYDTVGRGLASLVGGVTNTTISYGSTAATVTDPGGVARTYNVTLINGVAKVKSIIGAACPSCGPTAQTFDANGYLASTRNWNGYTTTYGRTDPRKNLETSRTEAAGAGYARTVSTTYDPVRPLPATVTEPGRTTSFTYDATGNILTLTRKDTTTNATRTWSFTYDARGRVLTMNGPRTDAVPDDVTSFVYYSDNATCAGASPLGCRGQLATKSDALGHLSHVLEYDAYGSPLKIIDANGATLTFTYDARQRVKTRDVNGLVVAFSYEPTGLLSQITQPDGAFVQMAYDAAHRLIAVADNLGDRIEYTLDAFGNRTAETIYDPSNVATFKKTRVFSNLGRLTQELGALGQKTAFSYDGEGNLLSITDPLGHLTLRTYDGLNRLVQEKNAASGITLFGYDALDHLTSVTDPRSHATTYVVDALGDVLQRTSPDTGTTTTTYDAAGNVLTRTDAKGQATAFAYDALNRATRTTYADKTTATYVYDEGAGGVGHLTSATDASGSRAYAYDAIGRLLQSAIMVQAGGATTSLAVNYTYDAAGRLSKMMYPSGRTVTYGRDTLGRISKIDATEGAVTTTLAGAIQYRPFGAFTSFVTPAGSMLTRTIDLDGRIASYMAAGKTWTVTYDADSRVTAVANAGNTEVRSYSYDALDRLTSASSAVASEAMTYDATGNRLSRDDGNSIQALTYAGTSNRLLTTGAPDARAYVYDANGSPTSDGTRQYTYDARGRLVGLANGSTSATYVVNAAGQRVAKTVSR